MIAPTSIQLDADAIRRLLPHRDVMALLDRIDRYHPSERTIVAWKHVAMNDVTSHYFDRHLRIYPPAMLTECLAQASGIMMNMEGLERLGVDLPRLPDPTYRATIPIVPLSVLAESHLKHESYATSGETILLQSKVTLQRGEFRYFQVEATSGGRTLAKGTILLSYPSYL